MNREQELLTQELIEASASYYNTGVSVMPDIIFDQKVEQLRKMEEESGEVMPGSPTQHVGVKVVSLKTVKHEQLALSLDKVKYKDREDIVGWLGDKQGLLSWKLDGSTLVLTYDNGQLVSAVTRGNGEEGSDITHNAKFFQGIPQTIDYIGHLVVRGEALMEYAEFERINAEEDGIYENPRNLATATIQMLDANESKKRKINFKAFELVLPEPRAELTRNTNFNLSFMGDRLNWLETLGFDVVDKEYVNGADILAKIEDWKDKLPNLPFPTDGLVVSYNDMIYGMGLGNTGHHFRHSIALKWTDETVSTTIRGIHWSVGKTGVITPVAVFDPVRLGAGSTVTRASLHNLSIMKNIPVTGMDCFGPLAIGSKAEVYLANMIIPQVASYTSMTGKEEDIDIPTVCPICGQPTVVKENNGIEMLYCTNEHCFARQIGNLMNTFSKDGLFVKGLGESQIEDLMQAGLVTADPVSFYTLAERVKNDTDLGTTVLRLLNSDGWGHKKWDNLIQAINASRGTDLQHFLYALNIPLLGKDLSKKLTKKFHGNIEEFKEFARAFIDEPTPNEESVYSTNAFRILTDIEGVGDEKAFNILHWLIVTYSDTTSIANFEALMDELEFAAPVEVGEQTLAGMTFVITGSVRQYANRDEFKASVEARGGKVAGSVSAKTNYLVNNDVTSTSGKNKKAKELGIEIISEDEFIARYGK